MLQTKYNTLIKKIRRNRRLVILFTLIAIIATVILASPMEWIAGDEVILARKGLPTVVIVLLVLFWLIVELFAYAAVSLPLTASLDEECDPEKHLILNAALNSNRNIDYIYAADYLCLGDFGHAMEYAEKMMQSKKEDVLLAGIFNKARCEFFTENYDAFRETAAQYKKNFSECKKLREKSKPAYQKMEAVLDLLFALAENDTAKIRECKSAVEPWNTSKANIGFINYIKGLAAYKTDDKAEAIYRFKSVTETCQKIVFAKFSLHFLSLTE